MSTLAKYIPFAHTSIIFVRGGYQTISSQKAYFWSRRALECVLLICVATIALYIAEKIGVLGSYRDLLSISDISLAFASLMLFFCFTVYVWPFRDGPTNIAGAIGSSKPAKRTASNEHTSAQADVVINAIDDGVIALDAQGNILLINPAAQKLIGWTGGDALSLNYKSVLKLVDSKDKPVDSAADPVLQTLNTNTSTETDRFLLITDAGKRRMISLVVSPVGEIGSGAIIVFRDVSKAKAEEKEQGEFISTASHEMRTPVASIEGYLGLALNPNTAQIDDKARDFIQKAHESAQHLGRLFQDLLDVSRADDGRLSNYPKVVDVVDYVGDIVEGLKPKADEKGLQLSYVPRPIAGADGPKTMAPVYFANVDNDHLREVVSNLTENAIKYTLHGEVIIDVTGDDTHVSISVKDSGVGIPAEDIPHLFQKFYRVDNSDTREIGGTGLGLYLCRRLAEVMGGRIDLTSEFKKGSTFTLQLPRIDRTQAIQLQEEQRRQAAEEAAKQEAAQAAALPNLQPATTVVPTLPIQSNTSIPTEPAQPATPSVAATIPEPQPIPATIPQVTAAPALLEPQQPPPMSLPSYQGAVSPQTLSALSSQPVAPVAPAPQPAQYQAPPVPQPAQVPEPIAQLPPQNPPEV